MFGVCSASFRRDTLVMRRCFTKGRINEISKKEMGQFSNQTV